MLNTSLASQQFKRLKSLLLIFVSLIFILSCGDDTPTNPNGDTFAIKVTPETLDFGTILIKQSSTNSITVENTSDKSGTITMAVSGTDASFFLLNGQSSVDIDAKKSAVVKIVFSPIAERQYSASLVISYGDSKSVTVPLSGKASSTLSMDINPSTLDFGKIDVNSSKSIKIAVRNVSATVIIMNPVISGADASAFSITYKPTAPLTSGKIDSIVVKFNPTSEKVYNASVTLDSENQYKLPCTGEGFRAALQITPDTLLFGSIAVSATKDLTLTFKNNSAQALSIASVNPPAGFTAIDQPSGDIPAGASASMKIRFSPTESKKYSGTITITLSNGKIQNIALLGEAYLTGLEFTPPSLDFGTVQQSSTKDLSVSIKNTSSNSQTIQNISLTSNVFTAVDQPTGSIPPGVSVNATVRFTPTENKAYNAEFTITTVDSKKYNLTLTGTGGLPSFLSINSEETSSAPVLDGDGSDAAWLAAKDISLILSQVEGTFPDKKQYNATIRSIHDNEYIYFRVTIRDDSRDDSPNTFVFKGGDASQDQNWTLQTNGQDGISFMFPTTSGVQGDNSENTFEKVGCWTTCHTTKSFMNYEGGSYPTKGTVDIWYWKAGTTNPQGFSDDYYASGAEGKYPNQKKGDENGNNYGDPNYRPIGTGSILPINVPGGTNNGLDKSRFIWDASTELFDANANNPVTGAPWKAGDKVPGWKLVNQSNTFSERKDIEAKGVWANGTWTVEFKRKLNTDNQNDADIVFTKGQTVPFSIAYFDNSRMYSEFDYLGLKASPRPGHAGSTPSVISLIIK